MARWKPEKMAAARPINGATRPMAEMVPSRRSRTGSSSKAASVAAARMAASLPSERRSAAFTTRGTGPGDSSQAARASSGRPARRLLRTPSMKSEESTKPRCKNMARSTTKTSARKARASRIQTKGPASAGKEKGSFIVVAGYCRSRGGSQVCFRRRLAQAGGFRPGRARGSIQE